VSYFFRIGFCGPAVAKWLAGLGYETFSVHNQLRGADDKTVLKKVISLR
jgi:hypothetical protein